MATLTIEIPDNASTKDKIAALRKQLAPIEAQRSAIIGAIRQIQASCPHTNSYRGRDIGGGTDGHCHDCDYRW
jgi:hypothetical protein